MTDPHASSTASDGNPTLWKYMTLGRFLWMLSRKQLWMTRVDCFIDEWEMTPTAEERRRLIELIATDQMTVDAADEYLEGLIETARSHCYVSSWTASEVESYAMWRIRGGGSKEGIAICTTVSKLRSSVASTGIALVAVQYGGRQLASSLNPLYFASRKRVEFAFEQEYRLVWESALFRERGAPSHAERRPSAMEISWDPEVYVDRVVLDPAAETFFAEATMAAVHALAPRLSERIGLSGMSSAPSPESASGDDTAKHDSPAVR